MMKNYEGKERHIGVELEYYGITPERSAILVQDVLNGDIEHKNSAVSIVKTQFGEFKIETDADLIKNLAASSKKNKLANKLDYDGTIKDMLSVLSDEIVPTELVSPPLHLKDLKLINKLQEIFVKNGACGTTQSFRFAFAAQLNPEVTSMEPEYILNVLRSFIMMTEWIKAQIFMDLTRKLTSYAGDFPKDYILKIFHQDYQPKLEELIDDYLKYNPTRNRGLDLLPLFSFIDEKKVMSRVHDERVNTRPTFHYRLPNCQLSLKSWNIEVEWSRWKLIEDIAKDKILLKKMVKHFYDVMSGIDNTKPADWLREVNNYVESFRS